MGLDASRFAAAVAGAGASAVSVLTEPEFFGGSLDDLAAVTTAAPRTPVLRKDFHLDPVQLDEAVAGGAAAVLLIARALGPKDLPRMIAASRARALDALVEVRSEDELHLALDAGATVIGVNSRDLETLEIDASIPARLVPMIPGDVVAVWESGVSGNADVLRAAECGADAVLVGSALARAADPAELVASLVGVPRAGR